MVNDANVKIIKKVSIVLAVSAGVLLTLFLALNFLASSFINAEGVKKKIKAALYQKTGATIEYQNLDLAIFPFAHAVIHKADISKSEFTQGTIETLDVYPRLLPLLTGRLIIDEVTVKSPDLYLRFPPVIEKKDKSASTFHGVVEDVMTFVFASLGPELTGVAIKLTDGTARFTRDGKAAFLLEDIEAEIESLQTGSKVKASCRSNIWQNFLMTAHLDRNDSIAKGEIAIQNFNPQPLIDHLSSENSYRIIKPAENLLLRFNTDRNRDLHAEITADLPQLTKDNFVINGRSLKASLQMNLQETSIFLHGLELDTPQLNLTGRLLMAHDPPDIRLDLEALDLNLSPFREGALLLAGNVPGVETLFTILKDGTIPKITFQGNGISFEELFSLEKFTVSSQIERGEIYIPGPDLELESITGNVVVEGGILKGEKLEARMGEITGQEGKLLLGLQGKDAPFHLDVLVQTELPHIPGVINHFVQGENHDRTLEYLDDLQGYAKGRIILGESLESVRTRIDVSELEMSAGYQGLPFPLKITGGVFFYDAAVLDLEKLSGRMGTSSFSALSAAVDFKDEPHLRISSGEGSISLDELFPWLNSLEVMTNFKEKFLSMKGRLNITAIELGGPLVTPAEWHYSGSGNIDSLLITWGDQHAVLKGNISSADENFIIDADLTADKLDWDALSGAFDGDKKDTTTDSLEHLYDLPIKGTVRISSDAFSYDQYSWSPFEATILFDRPKVSVAVDKAELCDIDFPGKLEITPETSSLEFQPIGMNIKLEPAISCLFGIDRYMTGNFDFKGKIWGKADELLLDSLRGDMIFTSKNGRIFQHGLLAKIFTFLNFSEIFRGQRLDLVEEGFTYKTIVAEANLQGSMLKINKVIIDSPSMELVYMGEVDLIDKKVDLKILVAPLKSADFLVKKTPLFKDLLKGNIVSIPLSARGDFDNLKITYLDPSAIDSGLLGTMKDVLKTPTKIMRWFSPGEEKGGN